MDNRKSILSYFNYSCNEDRISYNSDRCAILKKYCFSFSYGKMITMENIELS